MRAVRFLVFLLTHARCIALGLISTLSYSAFALELDTFIEPWQEIEIASPEIGVIEAIEVIEGQKLIAGDVIVRLDNRLLEAALKVAFERKQANASIQAARADYQRKQTLHQRFKALLSGGNARPEEVEKAGLDATVAKAQLEAARERSRVAALEYEQIQARIDSRSFRSPIDGVVTKLYKDAGELVTGNDPLLAQVSQLDWLSADVFVPARLGYVYQTGDSLQIRIPGAELETHAVIDYLSPVLDPKSGTVHLRLKLDNTQGELRSGQRAVVVVADGPSSDALK